MNTESPFSPDVTESRTLLADSERKLLREYRLGGSLAARNRLVELLSPGLEALLARMFPQHPCKDDLFQDACLALIDSIEKYDLSHPDRVRLLTFVRKRLLGLGSSSNLVLDHDDIDDCLAALPCSSDTGLDAAIEDEGRRLLVKILSTLSDRERDILIQRRSGNESLLARELAAYYGVSSPRITQLEQSALKSARAALEAICPGSTVEEGAPT